MRLEATYIPQPQGPIPVRALVTFPYVLPDNRSERDDVISVLSRLVQAVEGAYGLHTSNQPPVMVVNRVTQRSPHFLAAMGAVNPQRGLWKMVDSWSVDTCQDWLLGWGCIIDEWYHSSENVRRRSDGEPPTAEGILQIPGDLRDVGERGGADPIGDFLGRLRLMAEVVAAGNTDFVIGGYDLIRRGGKYLIDNYATWPLLYNWFPEVARQIRSLRITRPRSEFLAGRTEFFDAMLIRYRRFAYEQTTAFLINALSPPFLFSVDTSFAHELDEHDFSGALRRVFERNHCTLSRNVTVEVQQLGSKWAIVSDGHNYLIRNENLTLNAYVHSRELPRIREIDLGKIQDHTGDRGFREAIDQLERMERMMRQLWRNWHGNNALNVDEYSVLDERSASIRAAAMVTFRNFLTA